MADRRRGTPRLFRFLVVGGLVVASLMGVGTRALGAAGMSDAAAGAGSAVDDQSPASTSTTSSTVTPEPTPDRVFVAGDSLTFTALWNQVAGKDAPGDLEWAAWLGWTATDVQPHLDTAVAQKHVDTLVVALGTNDSSLDGDGDGWTATDVERFRQLIFTPPASACVVVVLPGYGEGIDPRHAAEMDEARADLVDLADQRRQAAGYGSTVVVDWQTTIDAHPDLLAADGIHLSVDLVAGQVSAEAAATRTDLYWQGVDACTNQ